MGYTIERQRVNRIRLIASNSEMKFDVVIKLCLHLHCRMLKVEKIERTVHYFYYYYY